MELRRFDDGDRMDRLFEEMREWGRDPFRLMGEGRFGTHPGDLSMREGAYVFVMDLPGFEREDISLTIHDGRLRIHAEHTVETESGSRHRHVDETVSIPGELLAEEASATYHNGVLEVTLPTDEEAEGGHRIEIGDE